MIFKLLMAGVKKPGYRIICPKQSTAQPPGGVSWDSGDPNTDNGVAPGRGRTARPAVRPLALDTLSGEEASQGHPGPYCRL